MQAFNIVVMYTTGKLAGKTRIRPTVCQDRETLEFLYEIGSKWQSGRGEYIVVSLGDTSEHVSVEGADGNFYPMEG